MNLSQWHALYVRRESTTAVVVQAAPTQADGDEETETKSRGTKRKTTNFEETKRSSQERKSEDMDQILRALNAMHTQPRLPAEELTRLQRELHASKYFVLAFRKEPLSNRETARITHYIVASLEEWRALFPDSPISLFMRLESAYDELLPKPVLRGALSEVTPSSSALASEQTAFARHIIAREQQLELTRAHESLPETTLIESAAEAVAAMTSGSEWVSLTVPETVGLVWDSETALRREEKQEKEGKEGEERVEGLDVPVAASASRVHTSPAHTPASHTPIGPHAPRRFTPFKDRWDAWSDTRMPVYILPYANTQELVPRDVAQPPVFPVSFHDAQARVLHYQAFDMDPTLFIQGLEQVMRRYLSSTHLTYVKEDEGIYFDIPVKEPSGVTTVRLPYVMASDMLRLDRLTALFMNQNSHVCKCYHALRMAIPPAHEALPPRARIRLLGLLYDTRTPVTYDDEHRLLEAFEAYRMQRVQQLREQEARMREAEASLEERALSVPSAHPRVPRVFPPTDPTPDNFAFIRESLSPDALRDALHSMFPVRTLAEADRTWQKLKDPIRHIEMVAKLDESLLVETRVVPVFREAHWQTLPVRESKQLPFGFSLGKYERIDAQVQQQSPGLPPTLYSQFPLIQLYARLANLTPSSFVPHSPMSFSMELIARRFEVIRECSDGIHAVFAVLSRVDRRVNRIVSLAQKAVAVEEPAKVPIRRRITRHTRVIRRHYVRVVELLRKLERYLRHGEVTRLFLSSQRRWITLDYYREHPPVASRDPGFRTEFPYAAKLTSDPSSRSHTEEEELFGGWELFECNINEGAAISKLVGEFGLRWIMTGYRRYKHTMDRADLTLHPMGTIDWAMTQYNTLLYHVRLCSRAEFMFGPAIAERDHVSARFEFLTGVLEECYATRNLALFIEVVRTHRVHAIDLSKLTRLRYPIGYRMDGRLSPGVLTLLPGPDVLVDYGDAPMAGDWILRARCLSLCAAMAWMKRRHIHKLKIRARVAGEVDSEEEGRSDVEMNEEEEEKRPHGPRRRIGAARVPEKTAEAEAEEKDGVIVDSGEAMIDVAGGGAPVVMGPAVWRPGDPVAEEDEEEGEEPAEEAEEAEEAGEEEESGGEEADVPPVMPELPEEEDEPEVPEAPDPERIPGIPDRDRLLQFDVQTLVDRPLSSRAPSSLEGPVSLILTLISIAYGTRTHEPLTASDRALTDVGSRGRDWEPFCSPDPTRPGYAEPREPWMGMELDGELVRYRAAMDVEAMQLAKMVGAYHPRNTNGADSVSLLLTHFAWLPTRQRRLTLDQRCVAIMHASRFKRTRLELENLRFPALHALRILSQYPFFYATALYMHRFDVFQILYGIAADSTDVRKQWVTQAWIQQSPQAPEIKRASAQVRTMGVLCIASHPIDERVLRAFPVLISYGEEDSAARDSVSTNFAAHNHPGDAPVYYRHTGQRAGLENEQTRYEAVPWRNAAALWQDTCGWAHVMHDEWIEFTRDMYREGLADQGIEEDDDETPRDESKLPAPAHAIAPGAQSDLLLQDVAVYTHFLQSDRCFILPSLAACTVLPYTSILVEDSGEYDDYAQHVLTEHAKNWCNPAYGVHWFEWEPEEKTSWVEWYTSGKKHVSSASSSPGSIIGSAENWQRRHNGIRVARDESHDKPGFATFNISGDWTTLHPLARTLGIAHWASHGIDTDDTLSALFSRDDIARAQAQVSITWADMSISRGTNNTFQPQTHWKPEYIRAMTRFSRMPTFPGANHVAYALHAFLGIIRGANYGFSSESVRILFGMITRAGFLERHRHLAYADRSFEHLSESTKARLEKGDILFEAAPKPQRATTVSRFTSAWLTIACSAMNRMPHEASPHADYSSRCDLVGTVVAFVDMDRDIHGFGRAAQLALSRFAITLLFDGRDSLSVDHYGQVFADAASVANDTRVNPDMFAIPSVLFLRRLNLHFACHGIFLPRQTDSRTRCMKGLEESKGSLRVLHPPLVNCIVGQVSSSAVFPRLRYEFYEWILSSKMEADEILLWESMVRFSVDRDYTSVEAKLLTQVPAGLEDDYKAELEILRAVVKNEPRGRRENVHLAEVSYELSTLCLCILEQCLSDLEYHAFERVFRLFQVTVRQRDLQSRERLEVFQTGISDNVSRMNTILSRAGRRIVFDDATRTFELRSEGTRLIFNPLRSQNLPGVQWYTTGWSLKDEVA